MAKKKQGFSPKKMKTNPHKTAKRLATKKVMLAGKKDKKLSLTKSNAAKAAKK